MFLFNKKPEKQILDYDGNRLYINGLLLAHPNYKQPKSLLNDNSISYDKYFEELSPKFISKLAKKVSSEETQKTCSEITKTLAFALNNLSNIHSALRDYILEVVNSYIAFLKEAVLFPELNTINPQVITYVPFLKELTSATKTFLINNK